jgi:hypothetical protein
MRKRDRPFTVNHICYPLMAFTQAKGSKRGLQSVPATWRDLGLDDKVFIHLDSFKINPKHNSVGAMKSTSTCSETIPGEIRDFLF